MIFVFKFYYLDWIFLGDLKSIFCYNVLTVYIYNHYAHIRIGCNASTFAIIILTGYFLSS